MPQIEMDHCLRNVNETDRDELELVSVVSCELRHSLQLD